jgi:hypothetical protein
VTTTHLRQQTVHTAIRSPTTLRSSLAGGQVGWLPLCPLTDDLAKWKTELLYDRVKQRGTPGRAPITQQPVPKPRLVAEVPRSCSCPQSWHTKDQTLTMATFPWTWGAPLQSPHQKTPQAQPTAASTPATHHKGTTWPQHTPGQPWLATSSSVGSNNQPGATNGPQDLALEPGRVCAFSSQAARRRCESGTSAAAH